MIPFQLLSFLFKPRVFVQAALFTSFVLVITVALSCVVPNGWFSNIELISSDSPGGSMRAGYFSVCTEGYTNSTVVSNSSTLTNQSSLTCTSIHSDITGTPVTLGLHLLRPYFVVLTACFMVFLYIVMAMRICASNNMNLNPVVLIFMAVSCVFCLVAAVWQEVAVHSCVVLSGATKGVRASGAIWSAFALLTTSLGVSFFTREKKKEAPEKA